MWQKQQDTRQLRWDTAQPLSHGIPTNISCLSTGLNAPHTRQLHRLPGLCTQLGIHFNLKHDSWGRQNIWLPQTGYIHQLRAGVEQAQD